MVPSADDLYREFLLGLLRAKAAGEGAEFCDKCGETIWPELELVRCDFCVGKHGAVAPERLHSAQERCKARIMAYEREEMESFGSDSVV